MTISQKIIALFNWQMKYLWLRFKVLFRRDTLANGLKLDKELEILEKEIEYINRHKVG